MSAGPDPHVDPNQLEQARRQISRLAEEIAHLSEMDMAPAEYYGEFLQRVLQALAAPAGAVWIRTPQGNLQLQYQINMRQVGLDRAENGRQMHDELLRQAIMKGQPGLFWPNSSLGAAAEGATPAGNATDYTILLAPILVDKQVAGIVEIWQDPGRGPDAMKGFLQFMVRMATFAASYQRNSQLRNMVGQQQVWTDLEKFARQIHGSLNPLEVSYLIANEGRRLVQCDRVSVAIRSGPKAKVWAISGADVVETRSNLVQLMRALFDAVMAWGERLVYSGTKDDTLPPAVNRALDAYLAESNSKLLVVMPLRDDRETNKKKPPRCGMMMECFEPAAAPEQLVARLEVVTRHATSALYNAAEYRRIPMRFLWLPLAKLQDGLGGKARFIWTMVGLAFVTLVVLMVFVQYPLKMDATGKLLPIQRAYVYPPMEGQIRQIKADLKPNSVVRKGQELILMYNSDLAKQVMELNEDIEAQNRTIREDGVSPNPEKQRAADAARFRRRERQAQLERLRHANNLVLDVPGEFWVKAPMDGTILSADFRELLHRPVKPNEPLLRIGNADTEELKDWEIELRIPQKHVGQVLAAYGYADIDGNLDVDLLVTSEPTRTFKGKLHKSRVSKEATPGRSDNNEPEPVVTAWVRITGDDIPEASQIPPHLLLTEIEVHARVRCGNHAMGYSLFYGVWEFIYEKIVFFF